METNPKEAEILRCIHEHGRTRYRVKCPCGDVFDFYLWNTKGKKCPGCKALYIRTLENKIVEYREVAP